MAGFRTHLATSTLLGAGAAAAGYYHWDYAPTSCLLAGGMCSVAGILPDVDSDSGIPLRESMAFMAAVTPVLLLDRFQAWQLNFEQQAVAAAGVYLSIRFIVAEVVRRTTVHRGMWHSIPAALLAALTAFLLCANDEIQLRMFKVAAVFLGFMSHLVLDEIYSVEHRRGRFHFKKSFGTALKFWGSGPIANLLTYGLLLILGTIIAQEPGLRPHRAGEAYGDRQQQPLNDRSTEKFIRQSYELPDGR